MGIGHAFLWDRGVMRDLGALYDGGVSTATDISDQGDIVGWGYLSPGGPTHAALWTLTP